MDLYGSNNGCGFDFLLRNVGTFYLCLIKNLKKLTHIENNSQGVTKQKYCSINNKKKRHIKTKVLKSDHINKVNGWNQKTFTWRSYLQSLYFSLRTCSVAEINNSCRLSTSLLPLVSRSKV